MSLLRMCPPPDLFYTEFHGYNGDCGECALSVALASALGSPTDTAGGIALMNQEVKDLQALGLANSTGATTVAALQTEALRYKASINTYWGYAQPFPHDWHTFLLDHAGIIPIVLQIAAAHNLPGDEAGVNYHFICVLGLDTGGYWVADGDNWAASQKLVLYSYQDLANAVICGLLALNVTGAHMLSISDSLVASYFAATDSTHWKCKQTGFTVQNGMLSVYQSMPAMGTLNGLTALGLPLSNEQSVVVNGVDAWYQRFERGVLAYDPNRVIDSAPGISGPAYMMHIDTGAGVDPRIAALQSQVTLDTSKMTTLSSQLSSAQASASSYQSQLVIAQKNLTDETNQLQSAQQQVTDLTSQLGAANTNLTAANSKLQAIDALNGQLQSQVDSLNSQLQNQAAASAADQQAAKALLALDAAIAAVKQAGS